MWSKLVHSVSRQQARPLLEALDLLERASELEPAERFQAGVLETVLYSILRAIEAYRSVPFMGDAV
jgi:hypothetical protein